MNLFILLLTQEFSEKVFEYAKKQQFSIPALKNKWTTGNVQDLPEDLQIPYHNQYLISHEDLVSENDELIGFNFEGQYYDFESRILYYFKDNVESLETEVVASELED